MNIIYKTIAKAKLLQVLLHNKSKALLLGFFVLLASVASSQVQLALAGSSNVTSIQSGNQFIYTLDYSVSSLTDVGHGVVADVALPTLLQLTDSVNLNNSVIFDNSQVASVSYNTATRTLHIVFVDPFPAGSTGQLQAKLRYPNGVTPNGYAPDIVTTMDADNNVNTPAQGGGTAPVTSNTITVTAIANNAPSVGKSKSAGGAIDNLTIYRLSASNGGSNGSLILNNPVLRDTLPAGVVFVGATKFNGSDAPTTYSISGGRTVVEWAWSSPLAAGYSGGAYLSVKYTSPTFSVGSSITNSATLTGTVNGLPIGTQVAQKATGNTSFNVETPVTSAACNGGRITAATADWLDHHVLSGTSGNTFSNGWYNSGNTEIESLTLTYHIDESVDFNTIRVNPVYDRLDSVAQAKIIVEYKTNLNGYVILGTYYSLDIASGVTPVAHVVTLPAGEYITDVNFYIESYGGTKLPIGGKQNLSYNGTVRTAAQGKKNGQQIIEGTTYNTGNIGDDGTVIYNNSEGVYFSGSGSPTAYGNCGDRAEILSPRPVFYPPSKGIDGGDGTYRASDIVHYNSRFYLGGNQTANGIVVTDTLDNRLIYQEGTSQYYNGSSWAPITPTVTPLSGGRTLLTYNIGSVTPQVDQKIKFDAQVVPGTLPGNIPNKIVVNATTINTLFTGPTNNVNLSVISAVALNVKKGQSGGSCGTTGYVYYPTIAHTLSGGQINYKITITNQGNVVAKDFILIDAFPFIGDSRGSNYFANMAGPATVSDPLSTVYYTTTQNPCSDDLTPPINPAGCNTPTWSIVPPTDLTTITGLKLTRSADLPVFDSIEITWAMKAPISVPFGNIMNNSVNYQVSRADNNARLLPATPNQVGMVADCINPIGSLGNYVWVDRNKNGLQDEAASDGLNGVQVYLLKDDGTGNFVKVDSTITGKDFSGRPGYYLFPFLHTGDYQVQFPTAPLDGYYLTTPLNQAPQVDLNSDANTTTGKSGIVHIDENGTGVNKDNMTIDAGYYPIGDLGNYVWYDDNRNGLQDEAASRGINGVKVYLYKDNGTGTYVKVDSTLTANDTSGKPGYYDFVIPTSGNYKVGFPTYIGQTGITSQTTTAGADGNSDASPTTGLTNTIVMDIFSHGIPKHNPTIDAGYKPLGSLGNYVWLDANNNGIQDEPVANGVNGIKVYLYKDNGSGTYVKVDSTLTANDSTGKSGWYTFYHLDNGNYKVLFPTMIGNYAISDVTNQTAKTDLNNDANKATGFSGVATINVLAGGLNKDNPTIDAGYRTNIGSLGNYVWRDFNGNGLQDEAASYGTNGVKVYLLDSTGTKIDSTVTANDGSGNPGYYNFPNLNSGNYQVLFPLIVNGFPLTPIVNQAMQVDGNQDADFTTGKSGMVTINTNSSNPLDVNNPTIDAGYGLLGTLGNYVWYDDNNNGIQDELSSNGVNGVKVILYKETIPGSGTYIKYDSTITTNDGNGNPGYYKFIDLFSANYKVQFPTMLGNYPISDVTNQAMQVDNNNDANKTTGFSGIVAINVTTGGLDRDNPTIDAGYRRNIGSLGNYVWLDNNNDGINNEPAVNGVNGVKVYLLNGSGTKVDSTITANDGSGNPGYYNFPNLLSGTYSVQFPTNVGNYPISDVTNQAMQVDNNNDANKATGKSGSVVINTASSNPLDVNNPTIDAGYRTNIGSLGNYVWYDNNNNGLQDEPVTNGINGLKVYLYEKIGGTYTKVDSTITANDSSNRPGYYNFPDLNSGKYIVQFPTKVGNYPISDVTNQAAQIDVNNDADKATGFSGVVTIVTNSSAALDVNNPTIDAGYRTNIGSLGNYVWIDTNADGIQNESTTNGINGVKVYLLQETAPGVYTKVDSTVTANKGNNPGYYNFPDLNSGNYKVQFPTSVYGSPISKQTVTPQADLNSDADSATGISPVVAINTSSSNPLDVNNPTIDAGYKYTVAPNCNMTASIGVNQIAQCVTNNEYQFTGNFTGGTGPYTFFWDFNDGTYGNTQNPTHTYATAGEHDVTLIVRDSRGCEAHASTVQIYIGAKPIAAFEIYNNSGTGAGVSFNSTSTISGGWMTYQWNLGNGTTSTLSNPGPIYYAPGTYSVTLIATGNFGCSDTITKTIVVPNPGSYCTAPTAAFNINNASQCVNGNVFAFTNATINGSTYKWNFGDGSAVVTTSAASHTYASAGTYTVTLIATNTCGSDTITKTVVVKPLPAAPAAISGVTSVNAGNVITLSTSSTGGVWSSSNPAVATVNAYGFVYGLTAGTTTISYTLSNDCGSVSATYAVTVIGSIVPPVTCVSPTANFTINTANQCLASNAYTFTNSTTGTSPTYAWDFGDGSTATTANGTHTYSVAGTFNVKLDVTNACGTSTITKTVVISDVPAQPASISGTTSVLVGSTTALSSATTGGTWSSNNTSVATVNPTTGLVTGIANGTATITYTVSNACGSASRSVTVTISTPVVPCVLPSTPASITGTTTLTVGATTTLSSVTAGGVWSSSNTGVATINPSTGLITAVGTGTTTISYTVSNACGSASASTLVTVNTACVTPVANFTVNNATQCLNTNSFVFTNTTTGTATSYTWSFGDGSSTATSPTHTYAAAGTYTVTLQASSACGGSSKTTTVTVQSGATAPAAIGGTPSVPVGSTTTLTSSTVGGAWVSSNTAVATVNPTTGVVTGVAAGTATISYTVNNGCGSASATLLVTVTIPCGAGTTSTTNATICQGTGYSFNGGYYTVAGSYTAHLTNVAGCDSAATLVLTVNPLPIQPTAITGTTSILVAGTTTLGSTPAGGVWSSANTAVATVNPTTGVVTGVATGSVAITYTVTNGCGSRSVSTTVTVGTPVVVVPPTPTCNLVAGFTINNNRQCVSDNQFVFTNTTTGGTAPYTYFWDLNDGTYASTQHVTKTYATYGEHDVTLKVTDANGCVSNANAQQLYVGAKPKASFSILTNTGSGTSTTFISSSTVALGTMSYLWDLGNGQTSTLVNPTTNYTPAPATPYTIKLIVSGWGTCKDTAIQTYTQYAVASVSVYPNPVMDAIQVSFRAASATPTTVKIMDLAGRVLQIQTVTPISTGANVTATLDTRGLQSGSYIVHISDVQNGFLATKAILKQ